MSKIIKFFIAGSWEDRIICRDFAEELINDNKNWICTTNWWEHGDKNKSLQYAIEDLENLKSSDILIVYNSDKKTTGKLIEIGIALGLKIPVFIYGNNITGIYKELIKYKGQNNGKNEM